MFAPVEDRHEGPVLKAAHLEVLFPPAQQLAGSAVGRCESDLEVSPSSVLEPNHGLHVFQVIHLVLLLRAARAVDAAFERVLERPGEMSSFRFRESVYGHYFNFLYLNNFY